MTQENQPNSPFVPKGQEDIFAKWAEEDAANKAKIEAKRTRFPFNGAFSLIGKLGAVKKILGR